MPSAPRRTPSLPRWRWSRAWRASWLLATAAGCTTPLDLGSHIPAVGEDGDGWTTIQACANGPQDSSLVGTWRGHVEGRNFPSGSNAAKLVISHANTWRACGSLVLGTEQPPWPPANPDVPYPAEITRFADQSFAAFLDAIEGIPMTLVDARFGASHLQFRASYAQWREWCSQQTPYLCQGVASPEYYCVPAAGSGGLSPRVQSIPDGGCFTDYGGQTRPVDCGKAALCFGGPCICTEAGCRSPPIWGANFDLVVDGDTIAGNGLHLTKDR